MSDTSGFGEWQPIETAPSGEVLMFSLVLGMAVWPGTMKWDDVTHWMPLPPPPQDNQSTEGEEG